MQDKLKNVEVGDYGEKYVTKLLKSTFGCQLIVLSEQNSSLSAQNLNQSPIKIISHNRYKVVYYKVVVLNE